MAAGVTKLNRAIVLVRDHHRCVVCGMHGNDLHHRRSRSVQDEHTHCPCNLVTLCGPGNNHGDHGWTHSNPFEARSLGLIISRHARDMPTDIPVVVAGTERRLLCNGGHEPFSRLNEEE